MHFFSSRRRGRKVRSGLKSVETAFIQILLNRNARMRFQNIIYNMQDAVKSKCCRFLTEWKEWMQMTAGLVLREAGGMSGYV